MVRIRNVKRSIVLTKISFLTRKFQRRPGSNFLKRGRFKFRYLFLLLVPAAGLILLKSSFFTVRSVEFSWSNQDFAISNVENAIREKTLRFNIFNVSQSGLQKLTQDAPVIKGFKLSKRYPAGVLVEVTTREPFLAGYWFDPPRQASVSAFLNRDFLSGFQKQATASGEPYLLDSEGVVFWKGLTPYHPPVFYFADGTKPVLGQKVEGRGSISGITFAEQFIKKAEGGSLAPISFLASLTGQDLAVKLAGGPFIFLPVQSNYSGLLDSLELILDKYHVEGKVLKKVDLRFNNPVVEY